MHEFGIAKNIFDAVSEEVKKRDISRVISIKLEVGKLTAIIPSALEFCFETIIKGTLLEGSKLDIIDIPLKMKCKKCSHIFEVKDYSYNCPSCENSDCDMISGDELLIKKLEIE